jgi:hypothetical protein
MSVISLRVTGTRSQDSSADEVASDEVPTTL